MAAGVLFLICSTWRDDVSTEAKKPLTAASELPEPSLLSLSPDIPSVAPTETATATETPIPDPPYVEAAWMAVGDIMMHRPQVPGAYDKSTKTYDFTSYFTEVKPILAEGDWVIANLETPVAGAAYGYTGYPSFNAPVALLTALEDAGFNMLTTANNHALDKGEKGLLRTLNNLKKFKFAVKGTAATQKEAEQSVIVAHNGIKMGLLSYTYGTNGIALPKGKPFMVAMIDEDKIVKDIQKTKDDGADFVTVALHFGTEYQTQPNKEQKQLARRLVAAGADIIAGSHPHVIQPYEVLETVDDDGSERKGLIIYSMGNFISNQRDDTKDYGIIYKVLIRKNKADGSIELGDIETIPTWVHRYQPDSNYRYRILPIEQTLAAATTDELLSKADYSNMARTLEELRERLQSMLK
ncbi:CapA family protein [Paenibacillus sp. NEAU-GSW1]|uniref:CapA family protein n=1 Tax=Paenibacillus sp. NEAU-GSW1 TaxID=2682486 RepID=UPI0020A655D1|nr:CapA family protein [Paenibacillus sp. NEAU-GSW1]